MIVNSLIIITIIIAIFSSGSVMQNNRQLALPLY